MADEPQHALGGRTPLQAAKTPYMDFLASHGCLGLAKTVPEGFAPGSDVANLSILGYAPEKYYTGRAPLEAASMGVLLQRDDLAFRCNLVRYGTRDGVDIMSDYSGGGIATAEAHKIITCLSRELGTADVQFYAGVSYRHVVVWRNARRRCEGLETTPPHDILGRPVHEYLPKGPGSDMVLQIMDCARTVIKEFNRSGICTGQSDGQVNGIWLWGQGYCPSIPTFEERYRLKGATVCAVDLVRGIGILAGLKAIQVPGATGDIDTDYAAKAQAALNALETCDLVVVHVEAPDEASHRGRCDEKIYAIEQFDSLTLGPICNGLDRFGKSRVLLLPDHPTPLRTRTHSRDPVPFALYESALLEKVQQKGTGRQFDEIDAKSTGIYIGQGWRLMDLLVYGTSADLCAPMSWEIYT